jgi:DNA repair protein radA
VEERVAKPTKGRAGLVEVSRNAVPQPLSEVQSSNERRIDSGLEEVNRLLGGGIVPGSMLLLGGEPGIGKSTLSLQIALSATLDRVLYVSGEESANQVKIRADRLSASADRCLVLNETLLENILTQCQAVSPSLLVVDSIQTLYSEAVESSAGSVSQVRECAAGLLRYAKTSGVPVLLIGHINKEGTIAGPKVLEHIVDVVLQFEGDSTHMYRVLRSVKNRFGSTSELAMFEMQGDGLRQITNPSELLLGERDSGLSGVAVAAAVDGARPMLVEVQALVSSAAYGTPQRSTTGFDVRRLNMLLAVLEKRAGFKLATKDVFLNIAGGVRIVDPGIDLAVVAAVLSSNFDVALPPDTAFAAEVGLSGEVRGVARLEQRIAEGQRLGFTHTMAAARAREGSIPQRLKVHYYPIARVEELAKWVLGR